MTARDAMCDYVRDVRMIHESLEMWNFTKEELIGLVDEWIRTRSIIDSLPLTTLRCSTKRILRRRTECYIKTTTGLLSKNSSEIVAPTPPAAQWSRRNRYLRLPRANIWNASDHLAQTTDSANRHRARHIGNSLDVRMEFPWVWPVDMKIICTNKSNVANPMLIDKIWNFSESFQKLKNTLSEFDFRRDVDGWRCTCSGGRNIETAMDRSAWSPQRYSQKPPVESKKRK